MKKINYIIALCLSLLLWSCERKELPEPVIEAPDFLLEGQSNNENLSIVAGENGQYAHAWVEQGVWGIYHHKSGFLSSQCNDCPGQFVVSIQSQDMHSPLDGPSFSEDVFIGSYPYAAYSASADFQTLTFFPLIADLNSVSWIFEDGQSSTEVQPTVTLAGNGPSDVMMAYGFNGICNGAITLTVGLGGDQAYAYPVDITVVDEGNLLLPDLSANGLEGLSVVRVELDGIEQPIAGNNMLLSIMPGIPHSVAVIFSNPDGVEGRYEVNMVFAPDNCIVPFYYTYITQVVPELGTVSFEYHHPNGAVYTTISATNQTNGAHFDVLSIEDYDIQVNGYPTKRVGVNMSCTLVNISDATDTLVWENVSGTMLFVAPE